MRKSLLLLAASATLSLGLPAQKTVKPEYSLCQYDDGALISSVSDNGQWATFFAVKGDGSGNCTGARLYNINSKEVVDLNGGLNMDTVASYSVTDVDNSGTIVVGELNNKPAYYSTQTKTWSLLPYSPKVETGKVEKITPDGHYAVGTVNPLFDNVDNYSEYGVLWDLQTKKEITLTNLPAKDMAHNSTNMHRFLNISADGRYILGCMSFVYIPSWGDLGGVFYYVYDVQKQSYKVLGFTESDTEPWTPQVEGLTFLTSVFMSNNGKYITGGAYLTRLADPQDTFGEEFEAPFLYNMETGEFKVFDDMGSKGLSAWIVDNNGNVYAAESNSPIRSFSMYSGGYWVDYAAGIKQHYGVNYLSDLGIDNSGTPIAISDDGKTLGVMPSVFNSYIISTPDNFADYVANVDLLSSYTIDPLPNSSISRLNKVTLNFTREVELIGGNNSVKLINKITEDVANSSKITVNGKEVTIEFQNAQLEEMPYSVQIPAKTFAVLGNRERTNSEISVVYLGRAEAPIKIVKSSPKENASVAKFDMESNPVMLDLDVEAMVNDAASMASLYRDDDTTPLTNVIIELNGSTVKAYPLSNQYLYKGHNYRLEIPAGTFTDVTGNPATASEKFVLNLRGAYEREISYDENIIFSDDLNRTGIMNFMTFDNDNNKFSDVAKSHGFSDTPDLQPNYSWMPVKDSMESTDIALASTSMYKPAGKSDDWLVLPQIYVFDQLYKLKFQSQSYLKAKKDHLKVYVWENDNVLEYLDSEMIERIRKEGVLVYDKVQSPGEREDYLADEWTDNAVSLEQFKGKNVYIAFLNDNEDQSEVYIDNIQVLHELPFYAQLSNDNLVVGKDEVAIEGIVEVRDEKKVYDDVQIALHDAAGNLIETIHNKNVSYKKGDKFNFKFNKPLALKVGEENKFSVKFKLNDDVNELSSSVKSLAFQPTKRVVLEECTGVGCQNCPLGIEAIERLSKTYADKFIPVAIHAYTGDPLGENVLDYAAYLGLGAAPTARVNRLNMVSAPMVNSKSTGKLSMNAEEGGEPLWADLVASELSTPVEADVTASVVYDNNKKSYSVPVSVKYALSTDELNLKVFAVVLENSCVRYQSNGFSSVSDPLLGEWGLGGKYASASVNPYTHNHVARGTYGVSYTGTADLLPNSVKAGETHTATLEIPLPPTVGKVENTEIVVMLFDGNTDKIINACVARQGGSTGIDGVVADETAGVNVTVKGSSLHIDAVGKADVNVYSVGGSLLSSSTGNDSFEIARPQYEGVVLVQVITENGSVTKKVIL